MALGRAYRRGPSCSLPLVCLHRLLPCHTLPLAFPWSLARMCNCVAAAASARALATRRAEAPCTYTVHRGPSATCDEEFSSHPKEWRVNRAPWARGGGSLPVQCIRQVPNHAELHRTHAEHLYLGGVSHVKARAAVHL